MKKKTKSLKRVLILLLSIAISDTILAQGINFEKKLSWQQVQDKAKKEHKYIFVDCFATWCVPCRVMDTEVYPDPALGRFINQLFVSVKVQMDSTKKDDEFTKSWYVDAHQILYENRINIFPAFLFFSPEGKLMHRFSGSQNVVGFLQQALKATDRETQEYVLLQKFRDGKLPLYLVPNLITAFEKSGDQKSADESAQKFINEYLLKLPGELLYKTENIVLIGKYLRHSNDNAFHLFYKCGKDIDSVTQQGYSSEIVSKIIIDEDITPKLWSDKQHTHRLVAKPDWDSLYHAIEWKYDKTIASIAVINPKIEWYKQNEDWPELINVEMEKIQKYAIDKYGKLVTSWSDAVNEIVYSYIFSHSTNKTILNKAADWQKMVVDQNPSEPDYMDTYANLLYKAGDKENALIWQEKAVKFKKDQLSAAEKAQGKNSNSRNYLASLRSALDEINANLAKMKAGKPTW